ncbi:MAG: ABC transporter permease [Solirubrobacteraceae bacterium]
MSTLQLRGRGTGRLLRRLAGDDVLIGIAAGVLVVVVVVALAAPLLAPHNPNAVNILDPLASASSAHPLGTDAEGRDLLSRLIYGSRSSLLGPTLVVLMAASVGTLLALVSVWFGGWIDELLSRLLDVLFALPGLLLAIVAAAVFGPGLIVCVIALTISYTPYMARLLRGPALKVRGQPYVAASELQGFSAPRIWLRHMLPALRPFIVAQAAVGFGYALIDLAALSFLGVGVQPPTADWGVMVSDGESSILRGAPQEALFASLLIVLTVVALNLIGERLAEPAERNVE